MTKRLRSQYQDQQGHGREGSCLGVQTCQWTSGSSIELQVRINCTSCRRPVQGKFWRLGPGPVYSETQSLVTLYQGFHFVTFLRLPSCDKRKWISYHLTQVWWLLYNGAYGWMTQDFKRYVQEKRADDIVWCLFFLIVVWFVQICCLTSGHILSNFGQYVVWVVVTCCLMYWAYWACWGWVHLLQSHCTRGLQYPVQSDRGLTEWECCHMLPYFWHMLSDSYTTYFPNI